MELLLKIAAGAVIATVFAAVLRRTCAEFALLLVLTTGIWILFTTAQGLREVARSVVGLAELARLDVALVEPVVKVISLSIITKSALEICKSAGEGGIAAFVELAGTVLALAAALPLVNAVVDMVAGLLV